MRALGGMLAGLAPVLMLAGCGGGDKAPQPTATTAASAPAPTPPVKGPVVRIIALGDSLFAGYGLRAEQAYPVRLEAALRARGINAQVVNAGVSGDTTQDGRARLDFTLAQGAAPDLVVISLGGNDMLRGLPLAQTKDNLDAILGELEKRKIKAVVMGMLAAPNMGPDYARQFNAIFPAVAARHHAVLEPFFLKAIFNQPTLQLPDHIHPTDKGVEAMVSATVDKVAGALPKE
ncbi:arylesterase [Novosphingobium sp. KACC 22771]|uniref:arylesterase n=1 Tax=Novosphingobium sp. KACC 22771 TaxID=3025670 RepID=UPI002366AFCB|nr:arylesterase [Novosphingobium sp. KACC 22771]WDF71915.1 arylesterase [Novosphingobium sp. KACC 22771]